MISISTCNFSGGTPARGFQQWRSCQKPCTWRLLVLEFHHHKHSKPGSRGLAESNVYLLPQKRSSLCGGNTLVAEFCDRCSCIGSSCRPRTCAHATCCPLSECTKLPKIQGVDNWRKATNFPKNETSWRHVCSLIIASVKITQNPSKEPTLTPSVAHIIRTCTEQWIRPTLPGFREVPNVTCALCPTILFMTNKIKKG